MKNSAERKRMHKYWFGEAVQEPSDTKNSWTSVKNMVTEIKTAQSVQVWCTERISGSYIYEDDQNPDSVDFPQDVPLTRFCWNLVSIEYIRRKCSIQKISLESFDYCQ